MSIIFMDNDSVFPKWNLRQAFGSWFGKAMRNRCLSILVYLTLPCLLMAQPVKEVVNKDQTPSVVLAYVTSWSHGLPDPAELTHINYAFGHVNKQFNGINVSNPERLREIVRLKKKYPALKICLSVGGWGSGGFSEMAADSQHRNTFARDCAGKITDFQLDGIDIDWEYPTSSIAKISASAEDTKNFTLLMQAIRSAIGPDKLLTLASVAGAKYINFKAIVAVVDFVNIMAYDMAAAPHHHSGLFRSSHSGHITVDEAVKAHIAAGIPTDKLVLGMPFYGHGTGEVASYIDYKDILKLKGLKEHWDDSAKVPFLTDTAGHFVCTYENPKSIGVKCAYIKAQGLRGAMYWDYSADSQDGTLRKAVYNGIMQKQKSLAPLFSVLAFFSANFDPAHISFAHEANKWFSQQAEKYHFRYDSTKDWNRLNDTATLSQYQAVLFLDNTPPPATHAAFEKYMRNGGGFLGFHVSAFNDRPQSWDWYFNQFLGCGAYKGNTWRPTAAVLKVDDTSHAVTRHLPRKFKSAPNEWYKWEKDLRINPDIDVLLSIDSTSFPLGTGPKQFEIWHSGDYPVVWTNRKYRMLYVNMGHNDMDYEHRFGLTDSTLSHTFSSQAQCQMILNALFWLGGQPVTLAGPARTDGITGR
ncbi:MAG TPA: glycosyl hydrolase family 18 protein [Arachidicoccus sp.]|nr:glycosyl hydrolase family 18 protein [Arachidicoccus sp.]